MPLYDCRCEQCGDAHEMRLPIEQRHAPCPVCGGVSTRIFPQRVRIKAWWQNFTGDCRHELRQMDQEQRALDLGRQYQGFSPKG